MSFHWFLKMPGLHFKNTSIFIDKFILKFCNGLLSLIFLPNTLLLLRWYHISILMGTDRSSLAISREYWRILHRKYLLQINIKCLDYIISKDALLYLEIIFHMKHWFLQLCLSDILAFIILLSEMTLLHGFILNFIRLHWKYFHYIYSAIISHAHIFI